jgi:Zn-dependent M28 family amino/carboxypeptidase
MNMMSRASGLSRRFTQLALTAILAGAAAVSACSPGGAPGHIATAERSVPPVTIDSATLMRDISVLAHDSMEGRRVGTPGGARARAFLLRRFATIGLQAVGASAYEHPFTFARNDSTVQGVNVVGMVRGTVRPDRYIVVSAHYDHLGIRDGEIFNGADDNASGTAALLQLATHFAGAPPRHSIVFVAFDAEEGGLRGAHAFVADPPVARDAMVLNVNMDMVGRNDAGELYVAGTHHYPQLLPFVERVAATAEVTLLPGHDTPNPARPSDDWTSASDHGAFHAVGIPFLYFGVEDHADYHRASDELDGIQPGFYARAVRTVLRTVMLLDAELD